MNRRQFFRRVGAFSAIPAAAVAAAYYSLPKEVPTFVNGELLSAEKLNAAFSMVVNGDVLIRGRVFTSDYVASNGYAPLSIG